MDVGTIRRGLRPGLVALFLLAAAFLAAQPEQPALRGWEEISRASRARACANPAWLLLLLPGTLFFGYALLGRRVLRRLPFLALLPLMLGAEAGGPEQIVREAESLYAAGQHVAALQRYRQAAELLPDNPVLMHDLALAANRAGERGYAIAYIRRAVKEEPRDAASRAALAYLEQFYELQGQVPVPLPVHPDLPFFLTLGFANLTLVMAGLVVRRGRVQFLIVLVLAAVFTAASLGVLVARLASEARPVGVLVGQTRLLRIPEPDSRVWLELPAGTTLWVRGRAGAYSLVETGSQLKGWVAGNRILLD